MSGNSNNGHMGIWRAAPMDNVYRVIPKERRLMTLTEQELEGLRQQDRETRGVIYALAQRVTTLTKAVGALAEEVATLKNQVAWLRLLAKPGVLPGSDPGRVREEPTGQGPRPSGSG